MSACNGPKSAEEVLDISNFGSIQQQQESILKGGSLNIFTVPYNPSPTICCWTLGNRTPTGRGRKQDFFCCIHRIVILHNQAATLSCRTAKLCPQHLKHSTLDAESKRQHRDTQCPHLPRQSVLSANRSRCSKFPPPALKNIFASSFCHLNVWIQLPGIVSCCAVRWNEGLRFFPFFKSMEKRLHDDKNQQVRFLLFFRVLLSRRVSQNMMSISKGLGTSTNGYFLRLLELLRSLTWGVSSVSSPTVQHLSKMRELKMVYSIKYGMSPQSPLVLHGPIPADVVSLFMLQQLSLSHPQSLVWHLCSFLWCPHPKSSHLQMHKHGSPYQSSSRGG